MSEQQSANSSSAEELQLASQLLDDIARSHEDLSGWIATKGCDTEPKVLIDALISAITDADGRVRQQALRFFKSSRENDPPLRDTLPQAAAVKRLPPEPRTEGKRAPLLRKARTPTPRKPSVSDYINYSGLITALCSAIEAKDSAVATLALEILLPISVRSNEYRIVRALCKALERKDIPLKLETTRVLGWSMPDVAAAAVPTLMRFLAEDDVELATEAAATLESFGVDARPAISALITVMADDQAADELRHAAARAVVACAPRELDLQSARSLADGDQQRVLEALCALGIEGSDVRHQLNDVWRSTSNPTEPPGGGKAPGKKKRGGQQKHDPKKDAEVAAVLRRHGADTKKAAKELQISVKDVKLAQDRHRKRPQKPNR